MIANKPIVRDELISRYKQMLRDSNLANSNIWLSSGSAMMMYGLREQTLDLDAGCYLETLKFVSKKLSIKPSRMLKENGYIKDGLMLILPEYLMDLHEEDTDVKNLNVIDGVNCYSLEFLLTQKLTLAKTLNRPKDHEDVKNIKLALSK